MRELPRLDASEQIQPAPVTSNAPALEQLHNLAQGITSFATQEVGEINQEQTQALEQQAGTDLAVKDEQLKKEAQTKFNDAQQQKEFYNQNYATYALNYINGLPAKARGYATKVFQNSYIVGQNTFDNAIIRQKKTQDYVDYLSSQNADKDTITSYINQNNFQGAQQAYQRYVNRAKLAAKSGIISPIEVEQTIQEAQKNYQSDDFLHRVSQLAQNNPEQAQQYIKSMLNSGIPGYSNIETLSLATKANSLLKLQDSAVNVDSHTLKSNFSVALQDALQKGTYNEQSVKDYLNAFPADRDFATQQLQRNLQSNAIVQNIVLTPQYKQNEELSSLYTRMDSVQYGQVQKLLSDTNKEINSDPYTYFSVHNQVLQEAVKRNETLLAGSDQAIPIDVDRYIQSDPIGANLIAQRLHGIPDDKLSVIPTGEAIGFVNSLTKMSGEDKIASIDQFMSQFKTDDQRRIAAQNLKKAGLDQNALMVYAASQNQASQGSLQDLSNWVSSDQNKIAQLAKQSVPGNNYQSQLMSAINSNLQDYKESLMNYNTDTSTVLNRTQDSVASFANYLVVNKGLSVSDAVKQASDVLVNNQLQYPSINGHKVQLRNDIDPTSLQAAFSVKLNDVLKQNLLVPNSYKNTYPSLNQQELQQQYINDAVHNSYLVMTNGQRQALLVDGHGNVIHPANDPSSKYVIDLDDLQNPSSQLYQDVAKYQEGTVTGRIRKIADTAESDLKEQLAISSKLLSATSGVSSNRLHEDIINTLIGHEKNRLGQGGNDEKINNSIKSLQALADQVGDNQ